MKTILVSAALWLCAIGAFGQEKTVTVDSKDFGSTSVYFRYKVDLGRKDTFNYCYISFADEQYKVLKSYVSIVMSENNDIETFKESLTAAIAVLGEKSTMEWKKQDFSIKVYDFSTYIYVYNTNRKSFFTIGKKNAQRLVEYLGEFRLGSNQNYYDNQK